VPENINEIWMTDEEYINDVEVGIVYEKIF
jgi:hypothetical protein